MNAVTTQTERQIMTEFLELYRDSPCLWSYQHPLYNNREAREQAYEVLLEKYSPLQDDANYDTVRKKIDNMRCSYKRERRKVLASIAEGGEIYKPSLWYYKILKFLDDPNNYEGNNTVLNSSQISDNRSKPSRELEDDFEFEEDHHLSESLFAPPKRKKMKKEVGEHIFISDQDIQEDMDVTQSQRDTIKVDSNGHEAEAFGKTIGLQLKELEPMQRFIAEKLISEVIFNGRLDKLNTQTNVSLNQDLQ